MGYTVVIAMAPIMCALAAAQVSIRVSETRAETVQESSR